jgi:hypothetical protein
MPMATEVKALMAKVDALEEWLHLQGVMGVPEEVPTLQAVVMDQLFLRSDSDDEWEELQGEHKEREGEDLEDEIEEEPVLLLLKPTQSAPVPLKPMEKQLPKSAKMIKGREQVESAFYRDSFVANQFVC